LRFKELLKVINNSNHHFTIMDYGCGYGELYNQIKPHYKSFDYIGFDTSDEMLKLSKKFNTNENCHYISKIENGNKFDYVVASGLFNVKFDYKDDEWEEYVFEIINQFDLLSKYGFSFNILTKYSDKEFQRPDLFYADPLRFFHFCKSKYSKYVTLIHDYPLYEFTILVKKDI